MTLVYLILAHKNPKQVRRLIDRLTYKDEYFIVHVDKKTNITPFIKEFTDMNNTTLLPEELRVDVGWGQFSMVEATLNLMKWSLKVCETGYSILLSGQDYPIKSNKEIRNFLIENYPKSFIHGIKLPILKFNEHEHFPYFNSVSDGSDTLNNYYIFPNTNDKWHLKFPSIYNTSFYTKKNIANIMHLIKAKKKLAFNDLLHLVKNKQLPKSVINYRGSQWWVLPQSIIRDVIKYINVNPNYSIAHKYTFVPDEVFIQSIVFSIIKSAKITNTQLTYIDWSGKNDMFPYIFSHNDLSTLLEQSNKFWARKFDITYDEKILDEIDKQITNL